MNKIKAIVAFTVAAAMTLTNSGDEDKKATLTEAVKVEREAPRKVVKPSRSRVQIAKDNFGVSRSNVTKREIVKRYAKWYAKRHYNYTNDDFRKLDEIWTQESHWNWKALNESSGAWGIAQMIMSTRVESPFRQIEIGLAYIKHRYGNVRNAYEHKKIEGWY